MARSMTLNPPTTNLLPGTVNFREKAVLPHEFIKLAPHPKVSSQPTPDGRRVKWLTPHNGVMLTGYGDWDYNHGPVAVCGYDLTTLEPVTLHDNVMTEAFGRIRIIDGDAYLPWTDPKTYAGNQGGFTTDRTGVWTDVKVGNTTSMVHTFDVAKIGGKIHVCGARDAAAIGESGPAGTRGYGSVWREESPGVWVESLRGVGREGFARFYEFQEIGEIVRVQNNRDTQFGPGYKETWDTTDGVNWVPNHSVPYSTSNNSFKDPFGTLPEGLLAPVPLQSVIAQCVHEGRLWISTYTEEVYISKENTF